MCMHIGGSQYKTPLGYMQAYTLANVKSLCPQQRIPTHPYTYIVRDRTTAQEDYTRGKRK